MGWIVATSLKFRLMAAALAAAILLMGISQLPTMAVDVLPEFAPAYVEVQTEALGLSAQEVEQLITVPLEQDLLNGVPWLAEIRSESLAGLSSVVLTFDPGTDPVRARQVVGERLTQAFALPHVSKPPMMLQPKSASSRVMMVGLAAPELSALDLSVLARWTIAPRLMGVPGVASVSIWGQRDRQLQVLVDPERLRSNHVTLLQVLETTGNAMWVSTLSFIEASTPGTGGLIETANQRLGIRHVFPISSPAGLAQVPVEGAARLRLGDVAQVVEDHQPLIGDAAAGGSGLLLVVEKSPSADTLGVTAGLDKAISAMRPGLSGVEINASVYRPASFIEAAIGNLGRAVLMAGLLIALVLGAFLFDWRSGLISVTAMAVSLAAGALVLYFRGAAVNSMVFAGFLVALAVVVDDAIVDVDAVLRRLHRQSAYQSVVPPVSAVILESAREVRSALLYATLIIALALVPIWLVGGLAGAFLQPLAIAYGLAISASMAVALVVTPALSLILLKRQPTARGVSPLAAGLQRAYHRVLEPLARAPRFALLALAGCAVVMLATLPLLRPSLVPSFKEPELLIQLAGAPGISQPEMSRIASRMSDELRTLSGIRNVGAHVGRALLSDRVVDVNSGEIWVSLDPAADYDRTVAQVKRVVDGYPGLRHDVRTYLQDRTAALNGGGGPLIVRVFGENFAMLRRTADDVRQQLTGIDGLGEQHIELPPQQATLAIEVDLVAAQKYGLKPGDVRRAAATLLSGLQAGSLFEDQKVFDVVVWGTPKTRNSLSSIRDLLLDTPAGGHVRLSEVARVHVVPAPSVIRHQDVRSYLDIRADVRGRPVGAVADDIQQRLQRMQFPLEYHAAVLGGYAAEEAAQARLLTVALVAALGILLILQAAFGSWRLAMLAAVVLPSALVGSLVVVVISGGTLSVGGLVGLGVVFAIATRHIILLLRHYQQLQRDEGVAFGPGLIVRGAHERLGPILATGLATTLAMLPFLVVGDAPGMELARPMAVVIVSGLVTATLLNVLVVPVAYLVLAASSKHADVAVRTQSPHLPALSQAAN